MSQRLSTIHLYIPQWSNPASFGMGEVTMAKILSQEQGNTTKYDSLGAFADGTTGWI